MYKIFEKITVLILVLVFLLSCQKEKVNKPVSYAEFSSVIGPEGKELHFYKYGSNLPDSLFPILDFSQNTFTDTARIQVFYEKVLTGNIPVELTGISENNYLWYFRCTKPPQKPVKLTLYFQNPEDYLLLDRYKSRFKLYRIMPEKNTKQLSNWEIVSSAQLDTTHNLFTLDVDNFDYGYCVFFQEIYNQYTFTLTVEGFINDFVRESNIIKQIVKIDKTTNYNSNFVLKDNISSFYITEKSKDIDYLIGFQFEGYSPGNYSGEKTLVEYCYYNVTDAYKNKFWKYKFKSTSGSAIHILKYGLMGELVEGNLKAELTDDYNNSIHIEMDFILTRAR
jgi:hypothetical protein